MKTPLSEAQTRQEIIDHQLARAGWGGSSRSMLEEFLVRAAERDEDYAHQHGSTDKSDGRVVGRMCVTSVYGSSW